MKDKKSLYLIATGIGLITTIAVAVFSTSNTSLFKSLASGMVHTSDKGRTLTLDSTTPLNIDGSGKGSLTVDTIGVYSPSCTESADGVANLRDIVLYCSAAGIDNNNRHYGFNRATIASVTLVINTNGSKMKICPRWARLSDAFAISDYTSSYNKESTASTENQTIEFGGDTSFIAYPQDTYPCIRLYTSHSNSFNLISLTVQYTCK